MEQDKTEHHPLPSPFFSKGPKQFHSLPLDSNGAIIIIKGFSEIKQSYKVYLLFIIFFTIVFH
jgi:hypothetical protein